MEMLKIYWTILILWGFEASTAVMEINDVNVQTDLTSDVANSIQVIADALNYQCPKGYRCLPVLQCLPCDYGTYKSNDGTGMCVNCPTGCTTLRKGAQDRRECVPKCPPGYEEADAGRTCTRCRPGYYKTTWRNVNCTQCPNGTVYDPNTWGLRRLRECYALTTTSTTQSSMSTAMQATSDPQSSDTSPQPTSDPQSSDTSTQPTSNPQSSDTSPQPTSNPQSSDTSPQPTSDPQSSDTSPQPTSDPQSGDTSPQPTSDPQSSDTSPQPTSDPQNSDTSPQPTSDPQSGDTSPQPTSNPQNSDTSPQPTSNSQSSDTSSQPTSNPQSSSSSSQSTTIDAFSDNCYDSVEMCTTTEQTEFELRPRNDTCSDYCQCSLSSTGHYYWKRLSCEPGTLYDRTESSCLWADLALCPDGTNLNATDSNLLEGSVSGCPTTACSFTTNAWIASRGSGCRRFCICGPTDNIEYHWSEMTCAEGTLFNEATGLCSDHEIVSICMEDFEADA